MSKYIDAEKLISEIERLKEKAERRPHATPLEGFECMGKIKLCNELFSIITSLQQDKESVAERFAKIVRGNLTEIGESAQKQFEQLYFEITNEKMYGGYKD